MYQRILVPVEHSPYDQVILTHVRKLARACNNNASIVLIHVADGWAARSINELDLRESEEMKSDREYIESIADSLEKEGFEAEAILAGGDPAKEIAACGQRENCTQTNPRYASHYSTMVSCEASTSKGFHSPVRPCESTAVTV